MKTTPFIGLFLLSIFQCFYALTYYETFSKQCVCTFSTFVFYFVLSQISQRLLKAVIIFSFLLALFTYPTFRVYGDIDYAYIASILYTDWSEATSYISIVPIAVIVQLAVLGLYTFLLIKLDYHRFNKPYMMLGLLLFLLYFPVKKLYKYPFTEGRKIATYFNVAPLKVQAVVIRHLYVAWREHNFIIDELKKGDSWQIVKNEPKKQNIVIIVGESVRKDFLHAYGFSIRNTDFIDSSPHIQFENYISVGFHTIFSLTRTLALSEDLLNFQLNNNIVSLANKAGYATYWISNQGAVSEYDSPIAVIGKNANKNIFLNKTDANTRNKDTEMLPIFSEILSASSSKPRLIILHMQGSHPSPCALTDGKYDEFILSKDVSCYNKTIRDTDYFLKNIYTALKSKGESFSLIYFSDHGLGINDDLNMKHSNIKEAYDVPLLVWGDDIDESKKINAVRVGNDFLHLFGELSGIQTQNMGWDYKFISEEKSTDNEVKVLDGGNGIMNYKDLKSQPIFREEK